MAIAAKPCPNCQGKVWDNRENKKNPKAPDFKCQTCGWVMWPDGKTSMSKPPEKSGGDARSDDIKWQVAFKEACAFMRTKGVPDGMSEGQVAEQAWSLSAALYAQLMRTPKVTAAGTPAKQQEPPPPTEEPPHPEDSLPF